MPGHKESGLINFLLKIVYFAAAFFKNLLSIIRYTYP